MADDNVSLYELYRLCKRIDWRLERLDSAVDKHATRLAVLEDRSADGRKQGAIAGGVSGAIVMLIEVVRSLVMSR